jgi:hypothetical protein
MLWIFLAGFVACGWLGIFRTGTLVNWGRKNYAKSKFVRAYPFASMVLKPWYPYYIRCAGIFIWLWALIVGYLVLTHNPR